MSLYLVEHGYRPQTRRLHLISAMCGLERFSLVCRSLPSRYGDRRGFHLAHYVDRNAAADGETSSPAFTTYRCRGAHYLQAIFSLISVSPTRSGTVALSRGVLHVVSTKGKPVPVSDAIIASLRERVGPDGFVELCDCPRLDRPQVAPGLLQDWPTVFERRLSDERRIEILIQTLQESLGISGDSHQEPNAVQLQTTALS